MHKIRKTTHKILESARIKIAQKLNIKPEQVSFAPEPGGEIEKKLHKTIKPLEKFPKNIEIKF